MRFTSISRWACLLAGLALAATVAAGLAGGAGAAAKGTERPFSLRATGLHTIGSEGIAARCPAGTIFRTFVETTGQASHAGRSTVSGDHCTFADLSYGDGHWTLTAANGDTINAPYEPAAVQPDNSDPSIIVTDAVHTITGGTGRFAGASGAFTCRVILSDIDWVTFTADLAADCRGSISY